MGHLWLYTKFQFNILKTKNQECIPLVKCKIFLFLLSNKLLLGLDDLIKDEFISQFQLIKLIQEKIKDPCLFF